MIIDKNEKADDLIEKFGDKAIIVVEEIIEYVKGGKPDWSGKTMGLQELQNVIRNKRDT